MGPPTSPGLEALDRLSTSGTSSPAAISPRSPPRLAVEAILRHLLRDLARSRRRRGSGRAPSRPGPSPGPRPRCPPTAGTLISTCETFVRAGCSNWLRRALKAASMSASVTAGGRHARRREDRREHAPPLGLGELRGMGLVVGLELGVGHRERVARPGRDQEVAGAHAAPVRLPGLPGLGLGDLRAVRDQRLQALPHQLGPELALEVRRASSGAASSRGGARSGRARSGRPPGRRRCA